MIYFRLRGVDGKLDLLCLVTELLIPEFFGTKPNLLCLSTKFSWLVLAHKRQKLVSKLNFRLANLVQN